MQRLSLVLLLFIASAHASFIAKDPQSWWVGGAKIENHSIRVNLQKGYADIEEDMEIRPLLEGWAPPSSTTPLEIVGDLEFAPGTSMVGMFLWNGNTILKAKLKPTARAIAEYESVVDREQMPPPAPRDPAILIRSSDTRYQLSIYPVLFNTSRTIRLRYIVPLRGNGRLAVHPVGLTTEGRVNLEVSGKAYTSVQLQKNSQISTFDVPFNWSGQMVDSLVLQVKEPEGSVALRTSFPDGEWKGEYFWMEGNVPDSLLNQAGYRREVVFLWKWNFPEFFLNSYGSLSDYGSQAVAHAIGIRKTMENAGTNVPNLSFGLVHQQRRGVVKTFGMGGVGSSNYLKISDYLIGITGKTLPDMVPARPTPTVAKQRDIDSMKVREQNDFKSLVEKSVTLFSPTEGVIKHIVVVTTGATVQLETPSIEDLEELDLPKDITIKEVWGMENMWLGVNMEKVTKDHAYEGEFQRGLNCTSYYENLDYPTDWTYGCHTTSYNFPAEVKLHFSMRMKLNGVQHYYDLAQNKNQFRLAFHTMTAVDSTLAWDAYNEKGEIVASLTEKVQSLRTTKDSAVVKIVAADLGMTSDVYSQKEIGAVFGVVRNDYALVALEADSIGAALNTSLQTKGLPHLKISEIFFPELGTSTPPPPPTQIENKKWMSLLHIQSLPASRIRILVQGNLKNSLRKVEILDLHGKVVANISVEALMLSGQFEWDGSMQSAGVYVLRIVAGSTKIQKMFTLK